MEKKQWVTTQKQQTYLFQGKLDRISYTPFFIYNSRILVDSYRNYSQEKELIRSIECLDTALAAGNEKEQYCGQQTCSRPFAPASGTHTHTQWMTQVSPFLTPPAWEAKKAAQA